MMILNYYFDDPNPSDPDGLWTNEVNATDGLAYTNAFSTASSALKENVVAVGTNAPATGPAGGEVISSVGVKITAAETNLDEDAAIGIVVLSDAESLLATSFQPQPFGAPVTSGVYPLSEPTGGWTWSKIQDLTLEWYRLDPPQGGVLRLYIVEVEVVALPGPIPSGRAKLSPVIDACIAIAESTGIDVGDGVAPDCPKPYIIVSAVSSPRYTGPLSATEADSRDRIQFSCVGSTRESADWARDELRAALSTSMLDAAFTAAGADRRTLRVILDIPRGVQRDDRGLPDPIFMGIDQYMIETTPTV